MIAGKIIVAVAMLLALVACSLAAPMIDEERAAKALENLVDGTNKETRRFLKFMSHYESKYSFDHVLSDYVNELHLDESEVLQQLSESCAHVSDADLNEMQETIEDDDWEHGPNDKIVLVCQAVKAMKV